MPSDGVENLEHGIVREWLDDGRLCVLRLTGDLDRTAVVYWAEVLLDTVKTFPDDMPVRVGHNLMKVTRRFPPYVRSRASALYRELPADKTLYGAYIVPDALANVLLMTIRSTRATKLENLTERIFSAEAPALAWLRSQV
ncbi:MAG: hypothetical protein ACOCYT_00825 [Chloroflexota bacterium]